MSGSDPNLKPVGDAWNERTAGCDCPYCTSPTHTSIMCRQKWDALSPEAQRHIGESADD